MLRRSYLGKLEEKEINSNFVFLQIRVSKKGPILPIIGAVQSLKLQRLRHGGPGRDLTLLSQFCFLPKVNVIVYLSGVVISNSQHFPDLLIWDSSVPWCLG